MRPSSAKAKGRRLQQFVRDLLLKYASHLQQDDITSRSMGAGGEDLLLSPAARAVYPFSFECKNVEKLNIWEALEQAEHNATKTSAHNLEPNLVYGHPAPLLVFKRNHSKTYVALELETFLKLTRR